MRRPTKMHGSGIVLEVIVRLELGFRTSKLRKL
jgi:hypothetical protein